MATGDAIRIPIPGKPKEALWLEYHDRTLQNELNHPDDFDKKATYGNAPATQTAPGIYAFVTNHGHERENPVYFGGDFLDATNFIRTLHNQGNHDFGYDLESATAAPGFQYSFHSLADNPIDGVNKYIGLPFDYNNDNYLYHTKSDGNFWSNDLQIFSTTALGSPVGSPMSLFPGRPTRGVFHNGFGYYFTHQSSTVEFQDVNKQAVYTRLFKVPVSGSPTVTPIHMPLQKEDLLNNLAIAADGKIVVSYYSANDQVTYVKRLLQNGEIDPSFQTVITTGSQPTNYPIYNIEVLTNGKILLVGNFTKVNGDNYKAFVQLNNNGTIDYGFMSNLPLISAGEGMNVLTDVNGKILVSGSFNIQSINTGLFRLNLDGTLDNSFALSSIIGWVKTIAKDALGGYLISGGFSNFGGTSVNGFLRVAQDGSIDQTYNSGGSGFSVLQYPSIILTLSDGSSILGGLINNYNGTVIPGMVKLNANGSINTAFMANFGATESITPIFMDNSEIIYFSESEPNSSNFIEMEPVFQERNAPATGTLTSTFAVTGTENDGFRAGDEIGLSGIVPITNYPQYLREEQRTDQYVLNGISVKVLSMGNGQSELQINFNDRELRENKRWCGNILLLAPSDTKEEALRIKSEKTLLIDLSGTANRHIHNLATAAYGQPFVNPTLLTVQENAKVIMEGGSEMVLDRLSTVHFEAGSSLEMENGALIRVKAGTFLKVSGDIDLLGSAKILIEDGGKMEIMPSATINLTDNASTIEVVGTLQIANGVNFDFTGNGDLVFNKPGGTAYCNIGGTSVLNLVGQGSTDVKLKVTNNTKANISCPITSEIKFSTCKITLGNAAILELSGKTTFYNSVTDRVQSGQKPIGVRVYALAGSSFSGAWFYNSAIGLDVNLVYSTGNPSFTACKYISNDIGLKIHGKGAAITGCTFTSNTEIDLELDANSMIVNVNNCTFNGTGSLGANLKGSAYTHKYNFANCTFTGRTTGLQHEWGSTSLSNCSFTGLETGVHVVAGTVASTCSEFTSCDYGITLDEFGRFSAYTQARNIFDGNIIGIWLLKGNINIGGGDNQFINNYFDILGDVKPTQNLHWRNETHSGGSYEFYRWPISRNKFTSITYPYTFNNVLYGVYGNSNYIQTPYFLVTSTGVEVPNPDDVRPVYIDCVNCDFEFESCGTSNPTAPIYADYEVLDDESPATTVILNSAYFNNVELKEAIRIASGNVSVTLEYPNNDSLALIHFKDILSQTYATGETEIRDALYAAQHLMGRALSNAYSLEILPLKYESVPVTLNIYAIELIDQLTEYIANLSPSENAEEIGNATIELALVYRLAAHYVEAIDLLSSTEAYNATSGRRDYWDCVCKAEYDLITEAYSLDDFQNQLNNNCNEFINFRKRNPFSKDKIDAILASLQKGKINPIRPNPTSLNSQVRLEVKGNSGAVVISDMLGRKVQRIEAKNGINDIELKAANLDNGVYFVSFFDDNKHLGTQKWVVSR